MNVATLTLYAVAMTQLFVMLTAALTFWAAIAAARRSRAAIRRADMLEHKVNGQMKAFKQLIRKTARADGVVEGRAEQARETVVVKRPGPGEDVVIKRPGPGKTIVVKPNASNPRKVRLRSKKPAAP